MDIGVREIVLPETKPETEWVRGRALQKMSPVYRHAVLQGLLFAALREWAKANGPGRVGVEWRFRIAPPGEYIRPLVPDVAYLSYRELPPDADEAAQTPLGSPTIAVEILSEGDRRKDVDHKTDVYLRAGSQLVIIVDPRAEVFTAVDRDGALTFTRGEVFEHTAAPGLKIDVAAYFNEAKL